MEFEDQKRNDSYKNPNINQSKSRAERSMTQKSKL